MRSSHLSALMLACNSSLLLNLFASTHFHRRDFSAAVACWWYMVCPLKATKTDSCQTTRLNHSWKTTVVAPVPQFCSSLPPPFYHRTMDPQATLGLENLELDKPKRRSQEVHPHRLKDRGKGESLGASNPSFAVQSNAVHQDSRKSAHFTQPLLSSKVPPISYIPLDIPPLGSQSHAQETKCIKSCQILQGNASYIRDSVDHPPTPTLEPETVRHHQAGHNFTPHKYDAVAFEGHYQETSAQSTHYPLSSGDKNLAVTPSQPTSVHSVPQRLVPNVKPTVVDESAAWLFQVRPILSKQRKDLMSISTPGGLAGSQNDRINGVTQMHTFASSCVPRGKTQRASRGLRLPNEPFDSNPRPSPTAAYIAQAQALPVRLKTPQRLLLVLDLNGTLLARKKGSLNYIPRPFLQKFLHYCFMNHSVLIWSSAKPHNVDGICAQLFTYEQRKQILGEWGRDTLGLTASQYEERVQVYKRLSHIWNAPQLLKRSYQQHPHAAKEVSWNQHNTILIDDSVEKAATEPFNHIEVPEFTPKKTQEKRDVLGQVVGWLEEARGWDDVSAFIGAMRRGFKVDTGWKWPWEGTQRGSPAAACW